MSTGSDLLLNGKPVRVVWAERSRAIVEVSGRTWVMPQMTPWELWFHTDAYDRGSYVQKWIMREEIDLETIGTA